MTERPRHKPGSLAERLHWQYKERREAQKKAGVSRNPLREWHIKNSQKYNQATPYWSRATLKKKQKKRAKRML